VYGSAEKEDKREMGGRWGGKWRKTRTEEDDEYEEQDEREWNQK